MNSGNTSSFHAGAQFGDYVLAEPLGRGGAGEVWRAENVFTRVEAAIKFCHDPALRATLLNEAQSIGELQRASASGDYPASLVKLLETHLSQDPPCLVMEYCAGGDLRQALRSRDGKGFAPDVVAAWTIQIARGLDWAHKRGILHRDIKPENLLLSEAWAPAPGDPIPFVKLTDFGLGRVASERALSIHRSLQSGPGAGLGAPVAGVLEGTSSGTLEYMSPEQFDGRPLGPPSDLYALGVVIFEMLVGRRPRGNAQPSRLVPGLDPAWDELFDRCYQMEPERRFKSAAALAAFVEERLPAAATKSSGNRRVFEGRLGKGNFRVEADVDGIGAAIGRAAEYVAERVERAADYVSGSGNEERQGSGDGAWRPVDEADEREARARAERDAAFSPEDRSAFAYLRGRVIENLRRRSLLRFVEERKEDNGDNQIALTDEKGSRVAQWTHQQARAWPGDPLPKRAAYVDGAFKIGFSLCLTLFALSIFFFQRNIATFLWAMIAIKIVESIMGDLLRGDGEAKRSRAVLHAFGEQRAEVARVADSTRNSRYLEVRDDAGRPLGFVHRRDRGHWDVLDETGAALGSMERQWGKHREKLPSGEKVVEKKPIVFTPAGGGRPGATFGAGFVRFHDDAMPPELKTILIGAALAERQRAKGAWRG